MNSTATAQQHYDRMTKTPVAKLILQLGIPTTVSMLISSIYNMADTYFVGTLGESAQAATGVLFTLQAIIQGIAFMLGHGAGTFIAKALAERDTKGASVYISTSFFTGAFWGCLILIVGQLCITPLVLFLGSTSTILPYAKDYGFWILNACPFIICSLILNNCLRYEGKAFYAMFGLTAGGLLNIFGDYLFVKVLNMGVYGAGLATAISQVISFLILLLMYIRMAQSRISPRYISKDVRVYGAILRVGLPSLIRQGMNAVTTGLMNNLTKPFGDAAIAAMTVVNRFSMFLMCMGLGIGQGFQPVAAFNYSAGKVSRVKKALIWTTGFCFLLIGGVSLLSLIFAEPVVTLFQKNEEVVRIGAAALRFASAGLLFTPLTIPVNMLYQSIRQPGVSSFLSLLRSGAVTIPILLIGVPLRGLLAVQTAQPIADCLSGLISIPFILRFLHSAPQDSLS